MLRDRERCGAASPQATWRVRRTARAGSRPPPLSLAAAGLHADHVLDVRRDERPQVDREPLRPGIAEGLRQVLAVLASEDLGPHPPVDEDADRDVARPVVRVACPAGRETGPAGDDGQCRRVEPWTSLLTAAARIAICWPGTSTFGFLICGFASRITASGMSYCPAMPESVSPGTTSTTRGVITRAPMRGPPERSRGSVSPVAGRSPGGPRFGPRVIVSRGR